MPQLPNVNVDRMDPVTVKALEWLSWEWQPVDDLIGKLAPLVPPGKGLRKYNQSRTSYENKRQREGGGEYRQREWTDEEKIASGQRALARNSVRTHIEGGRAEVAEIDGVKQVRLAPQVWHDGNCAGCGRPFPEGETLPPRMSPKPKRARTQRQAVVIHLDQWRKTS